MTYYISIAYKILLTTTMHKYEVIKFTMPGVFDMLLASFRAAKNLGC